jgi:signal transduction histidine kinase
MAAEVGAAGFVSKSDLSRDLLSTIDRVTKELTTTPPAECAESGDEEPRWLRGGGEMGALMRSRDWSNTLLGAIENWPRSLQVQRQAEETARRLSGRILQLQDEERRRIARELHDSVGQYLAMLKITLDRGERSKVGSTAQEIFQQCSQIVDQCISETRTMSHLLHPPLLDESGLLSAVRWYVEGFAARSGIEVQMNLPPSIPRLLKEIETTLFRILQESLTNVHRHSESKKVNVDIFYDAHTVSLRVRDFGKGIPLERIRSFRDRGTGMGVGLGGMRERVRELGGILRIEPCDPSGTVIVIEIPLIEGQKTTVAPLHLETPPQRATQRRSIAAS